MRKDRAALGKVFLSRREVRGSTLQACSGGTVRYCVSGVAWTREQTRGHQCSDAVSSRYEPPVP